MFVSMVLAGTHVTNGDNSQATGQGSDFLFTDDVSLQVQLTACALQSASRALCLMHASHVRISDRSQFFEPPRQVFMDHLKRLAVQS